MLAHRYLVYLLFLLPLSQSFVSRQIVHGNKFPLLSASSGHVKEEDICDVIVIGAGLGGLSAASILSSKYGQSVQVFESHYHAGGCAHSFPITSKASKATYQFDSGPTVVLGCSAAPYNPLMQVLQTMGGGSLLHFHRYDRWGMVTEEGHWDFVLGDEKFEQGPLRRFGGANAVNEFRALREACKPLCAGAAAIPTMALRDDAFRLLPLLRSLDALRKVMPYADTLNGSFEQLKNAHVKDEWLARWLDALAFSLSGLDAAHTGAATMAYTLFDLHRQGAALDYPKGGFGKITDAFVRILCDTGGKLNLKSPVKDIVVERGRAVGVMLSSGRFVRAKRAVICNAPIWALPNLLSTHAQQLNEAQQRELLYEPKVKTKTKSFLHLHLGIDSSGLDLSNMNAHFTVMDKGLAPNPTSDRNMVAVSNPSILDTSLVDQPNKLVLHAYGAGNEPFSDWDKEAYPSSSYETKKTNDSEFLFRSVSRALKISRQELEERIDVKLVGTPLTHKRFLMREEGTYGASFSDMLKGPTTSLKGLFLCGDSVFPGIGVPAVAVSGANCANTCVSVARHLIATRN